MRIGILALQGAFIEHKHTLDLFEPLKKMIEQDLPVFGTCAGLILLAKNIIGENPHLGVMDISVKRNAYGRQFDSFSSEVSVPKVSENPVPLVFIRAPWIESAGSSVEILLELDGHIVAARQNNILVTSFHPELTDNTAFLEYFIKMVKPSSSSYLNTCLLSSVSARKPPIAKRTKPVG